MLDGETAGPIKSSIFYLQFAIFNFHLVEHCELKIEHFSPRQKCLRIRINELTKTWRTLPLQQFFIYPLLVFN